MEQDLLKLAEVSRMLQISKVTLRKWDNKGILKAVRFGERKDRRYKREDIDKMLGNQEKKRRII